MLHLLHGKLELLVDVLVCNILGLKLLTIPTFLGLLLVLGGEVLRKLAMLTATSNFNHYIQHVKEEGHELVTHGVYSYCRHPSYVGWFYWSIGTQVMFITLHSSLSPRSLKPGEGQEGITPPSNIFEVGHECASVPIFIGHNTNIFNHLIFRKSFLLEF